MADKPFSSNPHAAKALRQGNVVKPMVTLPKAIVPECKVEFPRPMPCVVILIHGVNDVGEAFSAQAQGICDGLNARLGRVGKDQLTPGDWDMPKACGVGGEANYSRSSIFMGSNPIIPFYWGYRPVDEATYKADKKRYLAELKRRGANGTPPEAPYDAYYNDSSKDPKQGYQRKDNYGNPLNEDFCKGGGVFANATTNLIDMWLEGSDIFAPLKWRSQTDKIPVVGNDGDYSHSMHTNPHRIYMVNAAQRLANLIIAIRKDPRAKNDSINIIAHSQGTLVTMLANFLVKQAAGGIYRPADCVIFNNSPYSFVDSPLDAVQNYGSQQSVDARVSTFANFCKLLAEAKKPATLAEIAHRGVAGFSALAKEGCGRDNHGKVYNYFSPHDQTVAMLNIQGIGWQGVTPDQHRRLGPNFRQRMFFDNEPVWKGSEFDGQKEGLDGVRTVPFPRPELKSYDKAAPVGALRDISGEPLPSDMAYTFKLAEGCDRLGASDYPIHEAERGAHNDVWEHIPDFKPGRKYAPAGQGGAMSPQEMEELEAYLKTQGKNWTVTSGAILPGNPVGSINFTRYETPDEMRARTINTKTENSYHSSLVLNVDVSVKVAAYDLAIGRCKSYDTTKAAGGSLWQQLVRMADWRISPVEEDRIYRTMGILPPDIKQVMNKPGFIGYIPIPGIVNETNQVNALKARLAHLDQTLKNVQTDSAPWPTNPNGISVDPEPQLQQLRTGTSRRLDEAMREQDRPPIHLDK